MSVLNVKQNTNQQDPYCSFYFQDQNHPEYCSCKIMVKKSDVCRYMYCMVNGWVFKDEKREVHFQKGKGYTKLDTIINGTSLHYFLYDSEKKQVDDWIQENILL